MVARVELRGRIIGPGQPCFIIAEAGVNHNGRIQIARELVEAAAAAGADAVKFQTFRTEALVSPTAPKADYQAAATGSSESQYDMLKRLELTHEQFRELSDYCDQKGILFLSSPFDENSADLLESLAVQAFKIGSGEITNLPFLAHVARKDRPILLSTGMSTLAEVDTAVRTVFDTGNESLALFHCTSSYPTAAKDVNLRAMYTLSKAFGVPVGYSDHTQGIEIALAAAALGAQLVEKHFTLDRSMRGPDHQASVEPNELRALVAGIRKIEAALGDGIKRPAPGELQTAAVARKSLIASRDIPVGTTLTDELVEIKRPGTGLPPSMKAAILGRTTRTNIRAGEPIRAEDLS